MSVEQKSDLGQRALHAFEEDLPRLWQERPGQWVAYRGERLVGFSAHKHELYQQCFEQGLKREEFVVFCIEAQATEMLLGPDISV
jgi:hypothetical protein